MISADARKQQIQEQEVAGSAPVPDITKADNDQRKALKFGFSGKSGTSKVCKMIFISFVI